MEILLGPRRLSSPKTPSLVLVLALLGTTGFVAPVGAFEGPSGYLLLTDRAAAEFQLPSDVGPVRSWHDPLSGLTFDRYQQFAAPLGVYVDDAQLTVVRRAQTHVLVVGAHYPNLRVSLRPALGAAQAIVRARLDDRLSAPAEERVARRAELRLDPESGRQFYLVESGAPGVHQFHEVDAQSGAVLAAWDALDRVDGMGTGVKGDRKSLRGADDVDKSDNLTSRTATRWRMVSVDGRLQTYDARGKGFYGSWADLSPMTDNAKSGWANDNDWAAPYQRPAVDAQYYAALTDIFFRDRLGFDLVADCDYGAIRNVVHFDPWPHDGFGYDNAFWDGFEEYLVYGDGDGYGTRAFSTGQDVVTHELGHAVTQCRVELVYRDEPGALNEAFSDIMASAAEWAYEEPLSSNCRRAPGQVRCADWWLGEDVVLDGSGSFAFRSLADPAAEDQPSHYSGRKYVGKGYDNGGVHVNSGIINHAFYLMVNGGRNARCSGPNDSKADCDVVVPALSMADAERIFFVAWGLLTERSKMCGARNATVAAAELLFPGSTRHRGAAELAWAAVGRGASACEADADFAISLSSRSLALAPGSTGQLAIDLARSSGFSASVSFTVSDAAPATASVSTVGATPDEHGLLTIDVAPGTPSGTVPLLISASDGTTTRDAAAVLIIDADAPQATVDDVSLAPTGTVSVAGLVPLQVDWAAADAGSGLASVQLQHRGDGTSWIRATSPYSASTGSHRFRVVATDGVGHGVTSVPVLHSLSAFQEGSATFGGRWLTYSNGSAWGTTRYSKAANASATFRFTGTDVVWIASQGPKRGKVRVYLDGQLTRVDLYSASPSERRIVFGASNLAAGQHTLRIVVRGTSGRPRVDVDGFFVLAPGT